MVSAATADHGNTAPQATSSAARADWLDRARGLGMVLVVLGHAFVGVISAKAHAPEMKYINDVIYSFHMPLFFMLSGLVSASLMRQPPGVFLQRITLRTLYPYVLWSAVFLFVHSLGAGMTNTQSGYDQLLRLHYDPVALYWFLYALLVAQILGRLLWAVPSAVVVPLSFLMIVLGLDMGANTPFVGKLTGYQFIYMSGFYILAQRCGLPMMARLIDPAHSGYRPLLIVCCGLFTMTLAAAAYTEIFATFWTLPAAFGASILVMMAARQIKSGPIAALLARFGASAMAIYVTHVLITGSTRIGLDRLFGFTEPWVVVIVATVLGLALPTLADLIAKRLKIAALLGWR